MTSFQSDRLNEINASLNRSANLLQQMEERQQQLLLAGKETSFIQIDGSTSFQTSVDFKAMIARLDAILKKMKREDGESPQE